MTQHIREGKHSSLSALPTIDRGPAPTVASDLLEGAYIHFVGPYRPIMCGIGDYTEFITRQLPSERWGVLSFDPDTYGAPLTDDGLPTKEPVFHGIPGNNRFSASVLEQGLRNLREDPDGSLLWFQH